MPLSRLWLLSRVTADAASRGEATAMASDGHKSDDVSEVELSSKAVCEDDVKILSEMGYKQDLVRLLTLHAALHAARCTHVTPWTPLCRAVSWSLRRHVICVRLHGGVCAGQHDVHVRFAQSLGS
jgi:hypothetical protein